MLTYFVLGPSERRRRLIDTKASEFQTFRVFGPTTFHSCPACRETGTRIWTLTILIKEQDRANYKLEQEPVCIRRIFLFVQKKKKRIERRIMASVQEQTMQGDAGPRLPLVQCNTSYMN